MDNENENIPSPLNGDEDAKSFAELLAETEVGKDRLKPGQRVDAVIVKITPEWIFLDLGGKTEGYLDRREMADENGDVSVKEGDIIRAYFLSSKHNEKLFTTKVGSGEAGRSFLEDAWRNHIPIEGIVAREMKGGFEVKVAGGDTRSFCPYSQMGIRRDENSASFVGKRLTFHIVEFGDRGRNIVLSRREILKQEEEQLKESLKKSLTEGMTVKGKIVSIQKFGAFMDIGGIQGLIPISEIGWSRVENINDYLSVGQEVEAVITKLDWERNRISLSLKETMADPWDDVDKKYNVGSVHTGRVTSMMKFGAFVTLEPGIDGLIHISKLKFDKRTKDAPSLTIGQSIDVQIESIDKAAKRMSLTLASAAKELEEEKKDAEDYSRYLGKPARSLGSLHDLLKEKFPQKGKER